MNPSPLRATQLLLLLSVTASLFQVIQTNVWSPPTTSSLSYANDRECGDVSALNPNAKPLDRLARGGMTFIDGHSPDTVCAPSSCGLLTGRCSWQTEFKRGRFGAERACLITDDRMTLASFLRDHGHHTQTKRLAHTISRESVL
ncbi:MAG: hypothetical protein M2R45_03774 [Verrucomicrobia subdivision 3 bacterium]|nr:hypothetical protein [Limisphaerales bacterium]MCS1416785.1 hypothetical protein [Limisphaerales bacterium]